MTKLAIGFVFISTAPGKDHDVYDQLKKIPEIKELYALFGEYDLIAKIEADDFNALGQVVVNKVRTIESVIETETHTCIDL